MKGGRRRERSERGQAMVLAAFGIFLMCLAVITTMNIGRAVHQRIKLQNAADSAAYSLAAAEARTFNYIAFLNRAQIAHYNTAMMVQSYVNYVGYQVALFGAAADTIGALDSAIRTGCSKCNENHYCMYCGMLKMSAAWVASAKGQIEQLKGSYAKVCDLGHEIAQAMAIFNKDVIFNAQLARAALMNVQLLSGARAYVERMDPDMAFFSDDKALSNTAVNAVLNSVEYYNAFDRSAGISPVVPFVVTDYAALRAKGGFLPRPGGAAANVGGALMGQVSSEPAYKVMSELVNATRTPHFVFDRSDMSVGPTVLVTSFGSSPTVFLYGQKWGQTRMVRAPATNLLASIPYIGTDSNYNPGAAIASDDYGGGLQSNAFGVPSVQLSSGKARSVGSAIASYDKRTRHHVYQGSGRTGAPYIANVPLGVSVQPYPPDLGPLAPTPASGKNLTSGHSNHWPGFAPFFKFNASENRLADYNQPSTWIFLSKSSDDLGVGSGMDEINWRLGSQRAHMDNRFSAGSAGLFTDGMTVLARGMAYYHRPGVWAEQPNFFNPFWRARLAPVGQKLQNFWDKYVSSNITTQSKDQRIQKLVKTLKNSQMDAFTSAITSLITH